MKGREPGVQTPSSPPPPPPPPPLTVKVCLFNNNNLLLLIISNQQIFLLDAAEYDSENYQGRGLHMYMLYCTDCYNIQRLLMLVLFNSQNRSLREKMYMAYITRASQGDTDNTEIIEEIRKLRYVSSESMLGSSLSTSGLHCEHV